MTQEIIIDGVNVAECLELIFDYQLANRITGKYKHIKNICELGDRGVEGYYLECKNNDFCPYKQRKRLEQENKELKKQIESQKGLITVGGKQQNEYLQRIDELEQENKILKSNTNVLNDYITKNEQLKTNIDSLVKINESLKQENKKLKEENEGLKIKYQRYRECSMQLNKKYKSALEEINLILDELKQQYDYMTDYSEIKEIQDKINEVLQ